MSQSTYTPPLSQPCAEGKHEHCVMLVYRIQERWCACSCECHKAKKRKKGEAK